MRNNKTPNNININNLHDVLGLRFLACFAYLIRWDGGRCEKTHVKALVESLVERLRWFERNFSLQISLFVIIELSMKSCILKLFINYIIVPFSSALRYFLHRSISAIFPLSQRISLDLDRSQSHRTLTFAMSVIVFALSINFRWSILTFRRLYVERGWM